MRGVNALSRCNNIDPMVLIYVRLGRNSPYNFELSLICALSPGSSVSPSSASPPLNTSPNPSNIANIPGSAFFTSPS